MIGKKKHVKKSKKYLINGIKLKKKQKHGQQKNQKKWNNGLKKKKINLKLCKKKWNNGLKKKKINLKFGKMTWINGHTKRKHNLKHGKNQTLMVKAGPNNKQTILMNILKINQKAHLMNMIMNL